MPLTHATCPVDGTRIILVSSVNVAGDPILRYECPTGDWSGPWFTGLEGGGDAVPEVTRERSVDVGRDDTDNQGTMPTGLPVTVDRLYAWDSAGSNWDRVRVNAAGEILVTTSAGSTDLGRDDTDDQAAVSTGLRTQVTRLYAWDATGSNWDRVRINSAGELIVTTSGGTPTGRDDTDDQAVVSTGLATVVNRLYLFDGTNWDRARTAGSIGALQVGGPAAHDSAVTGNPVLVGAEAVADNATITPVTAADITRLKTDLFGILRVKESRPALLGIYYAGSGPHIFGAAADAATGGRVWLVNTSSTIAIALRELRFSVVAGSALITLTEPRINLERITFTGTPSGAQITPCKRDSTDPGNTGTMRTASTGMTITAGAVARNFSPTNALTAVGVSMPVEQVMDLKKHVDGRLVLRQNEGLVVRQADAGTAADTRTFFLDFEWEEYTL